MAIKSKHFDPVVFSALGSAIREQRRRLDLRATKLALLSGIDRVFLHHIECGVRQPTVLVFMKIALALESSPEELLASVMQRLQGHHILNQRTTARTALSAEYVIGRHSVRFRFDSGWRCDCTLFKETKDCGHIATAAGLVGGNKNTP